MIEQTIFNLLSDVTQIYPIHHQKLYPCATYNVIAGREGYTHTGNANLKQIIIQITAYDTSYEGAKTLQQSIFDVIDSFRNHEIRCVFLENKTDLYDSETEVYYCISDYRILYMEV